MEKTQIITISKSSLSLKDLALEYGCNEKTIRRNLKKFNLRKNTTSRVGKYKWLKRFGNKSIRWKGGIIKLKGGKILIYFPKHPNSTKKGYVFRSRLVMERHLKRFLLPEEVVHHKNRNPNDDKIENLKLFSNNKEHSKHHTKNLKRNDKGHFIWEKETPQVVSKIEEFIIK